MEYLIFFVDLIYKFWLFRSMIYYLVGIFKSNIIEIGFQFVEFYLCRVELIVFENMKVIVFVVIICFFFVVFVLIYVVVG